MDVNYLFLSVLSAASLYISPQDPEPFLSLSLTYFRPLCYISPEAYPSPNLSRTQPGRIYTERQNKITRNNNENFLSVYYYYYYYCYIIIINKEPHILITVMKDV